MRLIYFLHLFIITTMLPADLVFSADTPSFQNGQLIIPTVSTPDQVGQFQDVRFELTTQGNWQLLDFKETGKPGLGLDAVVNTVTLVQTDSFPVQVLIRVTGYFSNGCPSMGQINHRLEDNHFDIVMSANSPVGEIVCAQVIIPFRKTIPLPVYGLTTGIYSYSINGDNIGNFELSADNELPGDCQDPFECQDVALTF